MLASESNSSNISSCARSTKVILTWDSALLLTFQIHGLNYAAKSADCSIAGESRARTLSESSDKLRLGCLVATAVSGSVAGPTCSRVAAQSSLCRFDRGNLQVGPPRHFVAMGCT